jgi:3',5'-cyclic AMP phosphodiesterase CpdA
MANFNWLHLTDLHWGLDGQDSLWPNARTAFFDDLEKIHERSGPWNAVLFTGDFVQQGKREEFEQLEEKVLGPLWQHLDKLGSGKAQLLAVPGNHDLTRPDAKKPAPALKWLL